MNIFTFAGVFALDDADLFELVTRDFLYRHHDGLDVFRVRRQYTEFDIVPFRFELPPKITDALYNNVRELHFDSVVTP